MELVLDKVIRNAAFAIAVSPDSSQLAISSERKITVLSLPELKKQSTIPVQHTSSMIFLEDNCSMLILNTVGKCYLWDGSNLENLGRWPVPRWVENPLFYAGYDEAFWAGCGAVWKYNIAKRQITKVFLTEHEPLICRVGDGVIRLVTLNYDYPQQYMEIFRIDYSGTIIHHCTTNQKLQTRMFGRPCWNDDEMIAISTISAADEACGLIYLVDSKNGNVQLKKCEQNALLSGDFYCGKGLFAKVCPVLAKTVEFYTANDFKLLYRLDKTILAESGSINPPAMVSFLEDGTILVGSWRRLFVYQEQEDGSPVS